MADFSRPTEMIQKQNKYGLREVGLTHPDNDSFIKVSDNGDIHIMAADGLGIIISVAQHCIFLVGDNVKFLTKEDEGVRFNDLALNYKATTYSEPALIYPKKQTAGIYDGMSDFMI